MRKGWRRRAGVWALFALLLQLALPYLTVQQAAAKPDAGAAFVICTGAGLVWIKPDGTPVKGGEGDAAAHHCPVCLTQLLAQATLLPPALVVDWPPRRKVHPAAPAFAAPPPAAAAPPLPARGPPAHG